MGATIPDMIRSTSCASAAALVFLPLAAIADTVTISIRPGRVDVSLNAPTEIRLVDGTTINGSISKVAGGMLQVGTGESAFLVPLAGIQRIAQSGSPMNLDATTSSGLPASSIVTADPKDAEEAVTVWDTQLLHERGEYGRNAVHFYLHFENRAPKRVVGILTKVTIKNAFGRVVVEETFENEVSLAPGSKERSATFWKFEDNKFINGQPYDLLWKAAQDGTASVDVKILKVILEGGVVLTPAKTSPTKKAE